MINFAILVKAILDDCAFINVKIIINDIEAAEILDIKIKEGHNGYTIITPKIQSQKISNNNIFNNYKPVVKLTDNVKIELSNYLIKHPELFKKEKYEKFTF